MDSLPSSLLYFTQQLTNFTRNQIKINPRNTQEIGPNKSNQLRVALPVNSIANMKSLTLHCDLSLTGVAATGTDGAAANAKFPLVPRGGAAACIERCTWSAGGVALDNSATPYNVVQAVRNNLKKGSQKYMSDDKVLCGAIMDGYQGGPTPTHTGDADDVKRTVSQAITNFAGFTECEPTYLDLNLIPQLQLTVQSSPAFVIPWQAQGRQQGESYAAADDQTNLLKECTYSLDNCYFSLEVISIGSGIYDALTQRALMERGALDVPYPQFQVFSSSYAAGSLDVQGSVSCMSLDRVMFVQRRNSDDKYVAADRNNLSYQKYTTQQPPVGPHEGSTTFAWTQAAHNFVADDIKDWQMTINNAPMPLYNVGANTESFAIAMNSDDRSYSNQRGGLVSSQEMWLDNTWCAVQRLKFSEDPRRLSGLNLSSINSQIRVRGSMQSRGGADNEHDYGKEGLLITEQTSILRIGPGRAVSVVA